MKTVSRWLFYLLGMLVLALGLTLNTKAGLGVSPIISIAFEVSEIWNLNFGDMTFLLYSCFVGAQFVLRGKRSRLADLLQLPLSLVFSRVLNLYGALIPYEAAEHGFATNFLLLLAAIFCTGAGGGYHRQHEADSQPWGRYCHGSGGKTGPGPGLCQKCV